MTYDAEEKYQAMLRAHARLVAMAADIGKACVIGDPAAKDATSAFFMDCYHLKDWLKKDGRIKPRDVETFITNSKALSLAADLCNSLKHAGLGARAPRSGARLDKINMAYTVDVSASEAASVTIAKIPSDGDTIAFSATRKNGPAIATAKVILTIGGTKYAAPDLADSCVKEWDASLASQGVQFAKS
jgi:hypothetical protein